MRPGWRVVPVREGDVPTAEEERRHQCRRRDHVRVFGDDRTSRTSSRCIRYDSRRSARASASGRSNGRRLVSANAATRKTKYASAEWKHVPHQHPIAAVGHDRRAARRCRRAAARQRCSSPARSRSEIICALERRPPSSAYLLLDDQPASTIPYTPSEREREDIEKSRPANPRRRAARRPRAWAAATPNGITANVISAGTNASSGREHEQQPVRLRGQRLLLQHVLEAVGERAATDRPGRRGSDPCRSCIQAQIRRSASVSSATPTIRTVNTRRILAIDATRKNVTPGLRAPGCGSRPAHRTRARIAQPPESPRRPVRQPVKRLRRCGGGLRVPSRARISPSTHQAGRAMPGAGLACQ